MGYTGTAVHEHERGGEARPAGRLAAAQRGEDGEREQNGDDRGQQRHEVSTGRRGRGRARLRLQPAVDLAHRPPGLVERRLRSLLPGDGVAHRELELLRDRGIDRHRRAGPSVPEHLPDARVPGVVAEERELGVSVAVVVRREGDVADSAERTIGQEI
jgi:hypothetical protein